jgi:ankyrin repeat protein
MYTNFIQLLFEETEILNKAFCRACETGDVGMVHLFLLMYPLSILSSIGYAFQLASRKGHVTVVDRLLQDDRFVLEDGDIQKVYSYGQIDVIDRLLQDRREKSEDSLTKNNSVLCYACTMKDKQFIDILLQNTSKIDPSSLTKILQFACKNNYIDIVDRLLQDERVDMSKNKNTEDSALNQACANGCVDVVDRLLQEPTNRVDPSTRYNLSLSLACTFGNLNVVNRLLQDARVDPSANNNYALIRASYHGWIKIVNILLQDPRVDPTYNNNCVLDCARREGNKAVVERLLQDQRVQKLDEQSQ